ncbi:hypothetical protein IE53DRAFT_387773 [Violaceomyces palustris]|uniref:Uncharacterized protein n=1 Tax=Violaceomyces palustris TaxID=1673888 RepID=A0ACD0NW74_9BASI|nr:hypothetical protein IE53DRAFT_387773 [Violaceomyces palustris]
MVTLSHILIFVTVLIGLVSSVPVRVKPDVNLGCMLYQVYLQNYATEAATSADYDVSVGSHPTLRRALGER